MWTPSLTCVKRLYHCSVIRPGKPFFYKTVKYKHQHSQVSLVAHADKDPARLHPSPAVPLKQQAEPRDGQSSNNAEIVCGAFASQYFSYRWSVPWDLGTVMAGLTLCATSFMAVGFVIIPVICKYTELNVLAASPRDKALLLLLCFTLQTLAGLSVIWAVTAKATKRTPESASPADKLFNFSAAAPFSAPHGWAAWGLAGLAVSPVMVSGVAYLASASGYTKAVGGATTLDMIFALLQGDGLDPVVCSSLLVITGLLAPVLEETVFRGFLLTSLTKWMPTWGAVVVSSALFGAAHLSARDFPTLCMLGVLTGFSYVRSRNLLTPIVIHSLWNTCVSILLFVLAARGADPKELLSWFP